MFLFLLYSESNKVDEHFLASNNGKNAMKQPQFRTTPDNSTKQSHQLERGSQVTTIYNCEQIRSRYE